jgi:HK97 family phage major capsid protein
MTKQQKIQKLDDLNSQARGLTSKITDGTISVEERASIKTITSEIDTLSAEIAQMTDDDQLVQRFAPVRPAQPKPTEEQRVAKYYSITRAAQYVDGKVTKADLGSEMEVHQEAEHIARSANLPVTGKGLLMTDGIINEMATRSTFGTALDAGNLGQQTTLPYVDGYRKKLYADQLGATMRMGMTGVAKLPIGDALVSNGWVAENGSIPTLVGNARKIDLTPKLVGAKIVSTWHLQAHANPEADRYLLDLLFTGEANAINSSLLFTASNGPVGLFDAATGAVDVSSANGSALSRSLLVQMINTPAKNDIDGAPPKWVISPALRESLQNMLVDAGSGQFVMNAGGVDALLGYEAFVTTHMKTDLTKGSGTNLKGAAYGHWNQMTHASWAVRELIVDRNSLDAGVATKLLSFHDFGFANPKAFSVAYFT